MHARCAGPSLPILYYLTTRPSCKYFLRLPRSYFQLVVSSHSTVLRTHPSHHTLQNNNAYGTVSLASSASKTAAGTFVTYPQASDYCSWNNQRYACGQTFQVPAAYNCGKCSSKVMTFWCDNQNQGNYCCGSHCNTHRVSISSYTQRSRVCVRVFGCCFWAREKLLCMIAKATAILETMGPLFSGT